MDVVNSIRSCIATWKKGGESECHNILISPHCNPLNPECVDVLTTAYQTLLNSVLSTWLPKHSLTVDQFVNFVQSVLNDLPSSSSSSPTAQSNASIFGEYMVDIFWSVDAELDEIIADAKAVISTASSEQAASSPQVVAQSSKAKNAKQTAENDKEAVQIVVKKLLNVGILNPDSCRERLDSSVLAGVGLISDKASLDKKEIRTRTGLFYKQNKFNLLREQSEGYSKLTVELTSSMGPPHSPATGRPTETYSSIEERARPVWEKVISLIGYFDLDPNRALDIILDLLSVHLTTHYSFFLALLALSPWGCASKRPKSSSKAASMDVDVPTGTFKGKSLDEVLSLADPGSPTMTDGTDPRVLAQSSEVTEGTPRSLYLTAALLIREGYVALEDLYPHILPTDIDMDLTRKEYMANVQSRISGAKNSQLAMAAPLESSGSSSQAKLKVTSSTAEQKKPEIVRDNQKIGMLTALLAVGELKPAIAIISKFPWLVDAHPEIADLIIRLMKVSLSNLYDSTIVTKERNPSFTQPRARYGMSGMVQPSPRKPHLTLWAPTPPSTATVDFVFFFSDWEEKIPRCSSLDDLEDVIEPLMRFIGLHISRDPVFLTKFLRLGRIHLQSTIPIDSDTKKQRGDPDPEHPIRKFWFKILRQYLLPALPLIRGNAVCTVEVWNIIRQYETTARWRLYGEWKSSVYKSHPELLIREVQATRESKGILRRLSHNTIDSLSGTVAKLAHSNPCIFFANAVNQIMAYDNLANVVIQALRYVTNMGFDVLVFIILDALANPNKDRVKDDGVNTSDWLQSLASFTGMLFRRYSADLTPVLKYIVHQLHNGQTTEIVVLRELIWKMAGIEPLPSLSESQIAAMAGGPVLKIEAIASSTRGARLDPGDAVLKGPQRLGRGLVESSLALPLLIQVAQQRQACVYKAPDAHLKSLASLYDATHGVLLQYLELLTSPSVVSPQDYAKKVLPSVAELGETYGICAPICMQILRPVLHTSLLNAALVMQEKERTASEEAERRLKAALTAKREPAASASQVASPGVGNAATPDASAETKSSTEEPQAGENNMEVDGTSGTTSSPAESPWLPELSSLFDDIKRIMPGNSSVVIGTGFYTTFWQLSMYDLAPPATRYDEEVSTLRSLSREEDAKYTAADRSADRRKRLTAASHRTRRDRYNNYVNVLAQEFKEQTISRVFTMKRLNREKKHWFLHAPKSLTLVGSLIEHCIQPRCLLSPMDADFCAQFIKVIHLQGTPGFHTLMCYDKLLGDHVKVVIFSCSEYEARNYGRFLQGILSDLLKWHLDESSYLNDNKAKSAGKDVYHPGLQKTMKSGTNEAVTLENLLKWHAFQQIMRKWHRKLVKCFIECIQTGEFMHVYNTIIVLKEILPVFPLASVTDTGAILDAAMDRFLETEERGDLKILGRAYSASLKKREALWAVSKPIHRTNGTASPKPALGTSPFPEKVRGTGALPAGPGSVDGRRAATQTPSAPRAQLGSSSNTNISVEQPTPSGLSSTKLAMESIPRPEVVKRVRPDTKNGDQQFNASLAKKSSSPTMNDRKQASGMDTLGVINAQSRYDSPSAISESSQTKDFQFVRAVSTSPNDSSGLSRHGIDDKSEAHPGMPPPAVPSQTASAQELRETARQSINRPEKIETRVQNGSRASSPHPRSASPSSRPGTRSHSNDSRASGGRPRSDRGNLEGADDRRSDKETRQDVRDRGAVVNRRDSLTHNRSERRRDGDREDRDRDRGRDRHGDRDREKDRERDRERDRGDRDKDRDRDRHRRDEKDRDRDSRKERDASVRGQSNSNVAHEERGLPTRPEISKHRHAPPGSDDGLGKRRRPTDDDPERGSKRSTRKDGHREERRRPPSEKESHDRNRETDRRRKDREGSENEGRSSTLEKPSDKRIPEGPMSAKGPPPPSAPRAMSTTEFSRAKGDSSSGRDRHRDSHPSPSNQDGGPRNIGSLRSRIGDKESTPMSSQAPVSGYRADSLRTDEERDSRKRSASDRDIDTPSGPGGEQSTQSKRPRINRNRYPPSQNTHAIARKLLPIDPSAADKSQRRQDPI